MRSSGQGTPLEDWVKILRSKDLAATAADRWEKQYKDCFRDGKHAVLEQLRALGASPDPADVDRIIGNDSWTHTFCGECHGRHPEAVVFEEDEYGESFAVCLGCLSRAGAAFYLGSQEFCPECSRELHRSGAALYCPSVDCSMSRLDDHYPGCWEDGPAHWHCAVAMLGEMEETALPVARALAVRAFAVLILHGDEPHRAWLAAAAEQFIRNGTVPAADAKK